MTTTTTFQGVDPGSKSSSRVLQPPGGGSNISFGTDEKPAARVNRTASNIFAEPDDPHAHRRNNPPGGKPSGVLCGESSAPLRRGHAQPAVQNDPVPEEVASGDGDQEKIKSENVEQPENVPEPSLPSAPSSSPGGPAGQRNPPGGKSSLLLG
ncbi:hypothetical protein GJAV_G00144760 [Gymnothorax javanicus]|nr:hypothetical protein GJAV_G00144760 [Gymnothorax javanicus]